MIDYFELVKNSHVTFTEVVKKYYTNDIKSNQISCPFCSPYDPRKRNFSIKKNNHYGRCFASDDFSGDEIDFVSMLEGLSKVDACKKICNDFGILITEGKSFSTKKKRKREKKEFKEKPMELDITNQILMNFKKYPAYDYMRQRGISESVVRKYRISQIGVDKIVDKEYLPKKFNCSKYDVIMPIWNNKKVIGCISRRSKSLSYVSSYLNLKMPVHVFNLNKLLDNRIKHIFICESYLDALSLESLGKHAIALNSTSNKNYLIDWICHKKISNKIFCVCGDNDKAGLDMNLYITKQLKELGMKSFFFSCNKKYRFLTIDIKKLDKYNNTDKIIYRSSEKDKKMKFIKVINEKAIPVEFFDENWDMNDLLIKNKLLYELKNKRNYYTIGL